MRSRTVVCLATAALALAGCGGTKKAATTAATSSSSPSSVLTTGAPTPITAVTYSVNLVGSNEIPTGAPNGSANAIVSIKPSSHQLCWRFSQLKNVTAPTVAQIHHGLAGASGINVIPLDGTYKPSGCVSVLDSALLSVIETRPLSFYIEIHDAKYPEGAVRSQL